MSLQIKRLSKDLVPDFYSVNCESNELGWCNCVAWWCSSWKEFGERTAEQNKAHREKLFSEGKYDGYLLYEEGRVVGWSQCGPANRLDKLCEMYKLDLSSSPWAITCFALVPSARKRGLSKEFLNLMIKDMASQGVKHILGFPKKEAEDPWTGPEPIFIAAGFSLEKDDKKLPVYGIRF